MATPPTSYGYPGSINAAALATWLPAAAAARFSVAGVDDWRVTTQGGLDRGIRINAGTGTGDGIMDVTAEYETMALPLVESGSQWFLVVRRRNWSVPATTVPMIIAGTSAKAIPARSNTPGVESDQPLALCRVQAGQTVVQEIIDLRCWAGNGGVVIADILARDYLARPGADVLLGSTTWRYTIGALGVWTWVDQSPLLLPSAPIAGIAKPDWAPPRTWTGLVTVSKGAGGENREATSATNALGEGGLWFGYNGIPSFSGIYGVQLTGKSGDPTFLHVPAILDVSATRIKFKSRRSDNSNWANGYGAIALAVTVIGW
ncbi:hypothetical protein SAMN04489740_1007 [Arthrobacter alpinus]|uniref:Minor tail protein n=1 Tax=Arthrobacter alpinus TaxID=656366 RepID=A0A1H5HFY0_9MICC|nr:hypothetical protein [Arthrobacter alpinus]SEE26936.1 hypothetical protein SAMN04489740_1007 [Arthrobacter alpinus]